MRFTTLLFLFLFASCKNKHPDIRGIEGADRTLAYVYYENGKAGLLDTNRNVILPAQFDYIEEWQVDGMLRIDSGRQKLEGDGVGYTFNKYGLVNLNGQILFKPQFDGSMVADNSALVLIGNLYGYVDNKGNWLIRPRFTYAQPFYKGTAIVKNKDRFELIDKEGHSIIDQTFDTIDHFKNDVAIVSDAKKWGLINYKGKFILPLDNYRGIGDYNWYHGRFMKDDGKWYLIDTAGNIPIEEGFDEVKTDNEDGVIYAVGRQNGKPVKVRLN